MRLVALALGVVLLSTGSVLADAPTLLRLRPGDEVRLTLASGREEGWVKRVVPGRLSIRSATTGELRDFSVSDLRGVELHTRRDRGWARTHTLGIGIVSGFVLGVLVGAARGEGSSSEPFDVDLGLLGSGLLGATFGAAAGLALGSIVESRSPTPEWQEVEFSAGPDLDEALVQPVGFVWSVRF